MNHLHILISFHFTLCLSSCRILSNRRLIIFMHISKISINSNSLNIIPKIGFYSNHGIWNYIGGKLFQFRSSSMDIYYDISTHILKMTIKLKEYCKEMSIKFDSDFKDSFTTSLMHLFDKLYLEFEHDSDHDSYLPIYCYNNNSNNDNSTSMNISDETSEGIKSMKVKSVVLDKHIKLTDGEQTSDIIKYLATRKIGKMKTESNARSVKYSNLNPNHSIEFSEKDDKIIKLRERISDYYVKRILTNSSNKIDDVLSSSSLNRIRGRPQAILNQLGEGK